jgi:hypothetical protein
VLSEYNHTNLDKKKAKKEWVVNIEKRRKPFSERHLIGVQRDKSSPRKTEKPKQKAQSPKPINRTKRKPRKIAGLLIKLFYWL